MNYRVILCLACLALAAARVAAAPANDQPSVLVRLTHLTRGKLPRTVVTYGRAQAAPSASRTVMAPASVSVGAVYVRRGEEVRKGARLIDLLPSPGTAATYTQALTARRVAQQLLVRTRRMFTQRLATAQQLADAEKAAADASANLKALQAQGAGGRLTLRAPFRAIVTALTASPGAIVAEGTSLLVLARPSGLVLEAGLRAAQASAVHPGDAATVTPIGGGRTLSARVVLCGSIVDAGSGLVPIEIALPPGQMLPGEAAEVTITTGELYGYVVDHSAILVDGDGKPYVVQAAGMKARKVPVTILGMQGDRDVISGEHLDAGQPLVLSGNYQLTDGMRMRLAPASGQAGR